MNNEKSRIIAVVVILLVLITGIIFVRKNRQPKTETPVEEVRQTDEIAPIEDQVSNVISISTDKTSLGVGESTDVKIFFRAPGKKIFGSDIILLYDPAVLSTTSEDIVEGGFFSSYPRKTVDIENGIIKVSAYKTDGNIATEAETELVSIKFTALNKGIAPLDLSFAKGQTNSTTIVEALSSQNILEKVEGLKLIVE